MRSSVYAALCLGGFLLATPAMAQESEPAGSQFYVGGFLGARLGDDQTFSGANIAGQPRVIDFDTDTDLTGGVVLGAVATQGDWGRVRVEGEIAASKNSLKRLQLNGVERQLLEGKTSITTGMVNLMYDTPKIANVLRFSAGAGIGMAEIDYDIRYNVTSTGPSIAIPTSTAGHVAYQFIAGASASITKNLELTTDARFLRSADHQVERFNATAGTLDSILGTKHESFAVTAGFRVLL